MFTQVEMEHIEHVKARIRQDVKTYMSERYIALPWTSMYLSGGAICSHILSERINDFDFYFKNDTDRQIAIDVLLRMYQDRIKEYDPQYNTGSIQSGKLITDNAVTMIDGAQFITCQFGHPAEVKLSFDYLHCCPHYDIVSDTLYISKSQYNAIMHKKLVLNLNRTEPAPKFREDKFLKRGWTK